MAERTLRLRLGLFMSAALVALAGLVVLFGGSPKLFSTDAKYTVIFPEAPGVTQGTPIRKSGVRIGQVTALDLDPNTGQVRVRIAVDRKYLPRQTEDADITRGLLSGDTAIDFLPMLGPDNQPLPPGEAWPPGSEIVGRPPVTPRSILNPAASALANAQQSLDKITRTFEKVEQAVPKFERAAGEAADLFRDVRTFLPELRKTNQRLQGLIGSDAPPRRPGPVVPASYLLSAAQPVELDGGDGNMRALIRDAQETLRSIKPAVDELRATLRRLEPELTAAARGARQTFAGAAEVLSPENRQQIAELLKNLNAASTNIVKFTGALTGVLEQAERAIKNIDSQVSSAGLVLGDVRAITRPFSARAEGTVKAVADSAEELSKLLVEVRGVVRAFAREDGTLQKLLSDPGVYRNIDDAAASLARVMARAEKITRDLEVFSDKVARRPELIGIGGALHPSAGLKGAPGAPSYRPDWPPASGAKPPSWLPPAQDTQWRPPPVQGYKP
jgi:ABC-type transporter Mla subunit MlaD